MTGARGRALLALRPHGRVELARARRRGARRSTRRAARAGTSQSRHRRARRRRITNYPSLFDGRVKTLHPRVFGAILADRDNPSTKPKRRAHGVPRISTVVGEPLSVRDDDRARGRDARRSDRADRHRRRRAAARRGEELRTRDGAEFDPEQYAAIAKRRPARISRAAASRPRLRAHGGIRFVDRALSRGRYARERTARFARADAYRSRRRCATARIRSRARRSISRARSICPSSSAARRSLTTTCSTSTRRCVCSCARSRTRRGVVRAAIVKHTVPCGVAERPSACEAVRARSMPIRVSAYGGIIALDGTVDARRGRTRRRSSRDRRGSGDRRRRARAPAPQEEPAHHSLRSAAAAAFARELRVRSALGGVLAEDDDPGAAPEELARRLAARQPSEASGATCASPGTSCATSRANGVVVARDGDHARHLRRPNESRERGAIAGERAGDVRGGRGVRERRLLPVRRRPRSRGEAGCTAVIAPQGSIRDAEVVAAADRLGIALVFSTHRYFFDRHHEGRVHVHAGGIVEESRRISEALVLLKSGVDRSHHGCVGGAGDGCGARRLGEARCCGGETDHDRKRRSKNSGGTLHRSGGFSPARP
jgi:phosphoribosylaminoimidazolecarboxamide formyltransferase/IMP cyclohydrolase